MNFLARGKASLLCLVIRPSTWLDISLSFKIPATWTPNLNTCGFSGVNSKSFNIMGFSFSKSLLIWKVIAKERRALGELDHPDSSVINLKNVSHNIKEVHWEGNDVVGTVEILPTPSGNILKELLRAGILLGISSRGMGSTQPMKDNKLLVGEDFELIGWDFVSNPSTHGAFMTPMNESVVKNIGTDVCGNFCKAQDLMREIITELG